MIEEGMLDRLRPGDHACVVVDDDDSRVRQLATYITAGLRHHDKILYFGPGVEDLTEQLAGRGVDARAARARGQLRMLTPQESYLASGSFDPVATMAGWRHETERARSAGYRALRAIGDMSWASRPVRGADLLPWYEAQVNRVFADGRAMAICLYDRRLFGPAELRRICLSHPALLDRDTALDATPALRFVRTADPAGIRVRGEADLSNRHALRAVMEHLVADTPATGRPLTVDVSELRFADAHAVRILVHAAVTGAGRLRVVGCSPGLQRMLTLTGADAVTAVTVVPAA